MLSNTLVSYSKMVARPPYRLAKRTLKYVEDTLPAAMPWQRRSYARNGFLRFNPRIPMRIIDEVKAEVAPRHNKLPAGLAGYELTGRIQDAYHFSPAVRKLMTWPFVLRVLQEIYGRQPLPFQSLNFPVGTEQPIHSDTIHFNSKPAGMMCGVWIALEDIDENNGPLIYYPGSHKLPEYTLKDVPAEAKPDNYDNYPLYEKFLAEKIREFKLQPKLGTMRKGQAMIWSANLWHGGTPRKDRSRSRHSQVTHYFFEGCQYYTPMFSTDENVYWRHPEWVKAAVD